MTKSSYNPVIKFPKRNSYYIFYVNITNVLNESYEDAISYRYFYNHRPTIGLLEDKDEWATTGVVPLCILSASDPSNQNKNFIDSTQFEQWIAEYLEKNRDKIPEDTTTLNVYNVFNRILNYNFVYYPLSNERPLKDICNIFAKVNEKGMKLTTFDLMNAFLYPKGVELRKDLWENLDNSNLKDIDSSMNEYLLKLISLIKQNYCSSKYIYNLVPGEITVRKDEQGQRYEEILVDSGDQFKSLWNVSCRYAEKARAMIMNVGAHEFGSIKSSFIPNTTIVPVLGAVLYYYENQSNDNVSLDDFYDILEKWYWCAVLSGDYSGSSDSTMSKDYRGIKAWLEGVETAISRIRKIDDNYVDNELDLFNTKRGSAVYNSIISLISLNNAEDFYTRRPLGTGDFNLDRIDDHHIFPNKVEGLNQELCKEFSEKKDYILNRTLLFDETNNSIKAKKPSEYLDIILSEKLGGNEDRLKRLMKKHFISESALGYLWNDNFDQFINERNTTIKNAIKNKLGL